MEDKLNQMQEGGTLTSSAHNPKSVRRKTDIAWDHCSLVGGRSIRCNYCAKTISGGGIHRMKEHLANKKGHTSGCRKVPSFVQYQMQASLEQAKGYKRKQVEISIDENQGSTSNPSTQYSGYVGKIPPHTIPESQPYIQSELTDKRTVEDVDCAIGKWMYDACIPFNAVKSPYFQKMIDVVASIGHGYMAPSYNVMRTTVLEKTVNEVTDIVETFRKYWKFSGCTIMADSWTDVRQRTLINFLIYCPEGTVFWKSVDGSEYSKTCEKLFELFKSVIEFVGPENVVQFVTRNASNYASAGRLVKKHYGHIFWTPCATHCIDLMLEKFDTIPEIKNVIEDAREITKFIYNHTFVLNLMRKFCKGELLCPANTRFATNFLAIQSLYEHKDDLFSMVASKEWIDHKISKTSIAMGVKEKIVNIAWWNACEHTIKIIEPLVKVLGMVDSDEHPSMGYIYEGMGRAKESIKNAFGGRAQDSDQYISIVDEKWETQLHHPLHAAGFLLNPQFFYKDDGLFAHRIIKSGFWNAVETMYHNDEPMVDKISMELELYEKARGEFGRSVAIRNRDKMQPAIWWSYFGGEAPNLQQMAIRVLSQTCSVSGNEYNRSAFERIHTEKRNRLEHKRLNDLLYVQCNLHLRERFSKKKGNNDPISFEDMGLFDAWVEEPTIDNVEDLTEWLNEDFASIVNIDYGNEE